MSEKFDWRSTLKEVVEEKRRHLGPHPGHDRLVAYQAGELGEEEAKELQDHLVLCPQCAGQLLELDAFAADAAAPRSNVVPIEPHRNEWWRWWPAAAAVAAVVLILVVRWPAGEPLPRYAPPKFLGYSSPTRGAAPDEEIPVYTQGDTLGIQLRPETALDDPATARVYLQHGETFRALGAGRLEVDSKGVVSLEGRVGTNLPLPVGESELIVSVARPGYLPSRGRLREELAASDRAGSSRWIAFSRKIQILDEPATDGATAAIEVPSGSIHDVLLVEYAGCVTVLIGPVCILKDDRRLTLWVRHRQDSEIRIYAGRWWEGWWKHDRGTAVGGGFRYDIEVGTTQEVVVEVLRDEKRLIWALEVAKGAPLDTKAGRLSDEIRTAAGRAFDLIGERRFSEADRLLDSLPVQATGGFAESRYFLAFHRGLLAEERGDLRTALRWTDRADRIAEGTGLNRWRLYAADHLARQLSTVGLVDNAAAVHSRMQPQVASWCGDGDGASLLDPCDCARFDVNRAWVGLLTEEAGRSVKGPDDPSSLLENAERIFRKAARDGEECLRDEDLPNVLINRALAALHAGNPDQARHHLRRTKIDPDELPRLALWQLEIEARILLANSRPQEALDLYEQLGTRSRSGSSPEASWRAAFGRARTLERLGRSGEAIEACTEVGQLLDQESLLVSKEAREMFAAQREGASRFCLDLLLRANREGEASAVIRHSAAQALSSLRFGAGMAGLEEVDRRLAVETRLEIEELRAQIRAGQPLDRERRLRDEIESKRRALRDLLDRVASPAGRSGTAGPDLAPSTDGVVVLAYHPLLEGWAAMASDRRGLTVHRIKELTPATDDNEVSSRLLEPFADRIGRVAEVRVIPYGDLRNFDFHALPFGEGILLDHAPVVYHLDLPAPTIEGPPPYAAMVVAGPGPRQASNEAKQVTRFLESHPDFGIVKKLAGATGLDVRTQLAEADLFHFAGHAKYDDQSRGWDSYLELSGGGRLTVDDILALPHVPRWVVLSGCETGRDSRAAPLPSIGLAQAFLVAGAESVVAATAEVSDQDAAVLMSAFYRHWTSSTSIAVALQRAQLELRDKDPDSDWRKFRILGR